MSDINNANPEEDNDQVEKRKEDHISLSFQSKTGLDQLDSRFYYEPILAGFPDKSSSPTTFLGKQFNQPIWISSMTGGSELARKINHNLAKAAGEYGLGMGLGSCRSLLYSDDFFDDFNIRSKIGEQALYANLGIAQIAYLIHNKDTARIVEMIKKLQADGLIIHVNPMQEYMQVEGDIIDTSPLTTITQLIDLHPDIKIIVKEVGQGMGPNSLRELLKLPLEAVDFAAYGGTNFSVLEELRNPDTNELDPLCFVGHTAEEMVGFTNDILSSNQEINCNQIIISGGVKTYLDGYYLINKSNIPAIYGQAGAFLKHAREDYEQLQSFVEAQIKGLEMAKNYLVVK